MFSPLRWERERETAVIAGVTMSWFAFAKIKSELDEKLGFGQIRQFLSRTAWWVNCWWNFNSFNLISHAVLRKSLSFSFLRALDLYVYMYYGMYVYMLTLVLPTNRLGADEWNVIGNQMVDFFPFPSFEGLNLHILCTLRVGKIVKFLTWQSSISCIFTVTSAWRAGRLHNCTIVGSYTKVEVLNHRQTTCFTLLIPSNPKW